MKLDAKYDLPAGPVTVTSNVQRCLDGCLEGLKRVSVVVMEDGGEVTVGGFHVQGGQDEYPVETPEEILDTAYRLGFMKSKELEREVLLKFKFFGHGAGKNPTGSVQVHVIDPQTNTGNDQNNAEVMHHLAGDDPNSAIAIGAIQATKLAHNMTVRAMTVLENTNSDLRRDLNNASNREASLAHALIDGQVHSLERDTAREDRVYGTLDNALQATIDNARMFGEIHRREVTMDLEMERARLKADGTTAFMKEIGGQLSAAAPLLMMVAMSKLTDGNPEAMSAMMNGMGGAMPGAPPAPTGATPPPPAPPRSRAAPQGRPPASAAVPQPRTRPRPTPVPTVSAPVTAAPAVPAPVTIKPGEGIGALSAAVGATITAMQWSQFATLLSPEHVQRLRDWLSNTPQSDQDAIGAMLRCVQVKEIAHALGPADIITNEQGLKLEGVLTQLYASMGVAPPPTSESVGAGPADPPALTVVASESTNRSGAASSEDSASNTAAESDADTDSESDIDTDAESEDSESDSDASAAPAGDGDPKSTGTSASKSKKKTKASKSKKAAKKATKKASASKSKRRGGARTS